MHALHLCLLQHFVRFMPFACLASDLMPLLQSAIMRFQDSNGRIPSLDDLADLAFDLDRAPRATGSPEWAPLNEGLGKPQTACARSHLVWPSSARPKGRQPSFANVVVHSCW